LIKIVVADDQPLARGGFRLILEAEDGLTVVGEASDGEEAVSRGCDVSSAIVVIEPRC
jgi:DNA-binding NarL/FixJ family response regulator